jgi:hypothetical protein
VDAHVLQLQLQESLRGYAFLLLSNMKRKGHMYVCKSENGMRIGSRDYDCRRFG